MELPSSPDRAADGAALEQAELTSNSAPPSMTINDPIAAALVFSFEPLEIFESSLGSLMK